MALTELCEVSLPGAMKAGLPCHKFITVKTRGRVSLGVPNEKQQPSNNTEVHAWPQESNPKINNLVIRATSRRCGGSPHGSVRSQIYSLGKSFFSSTPEPWPSHEGVALTFQRGTLGTRLSLLASPPPSRVWRSERWTRLLVLAGNEARPGL